MAIDLTKYTITTTRRVKGGGGKTTTSRVGVDDGNDFSAGQIVHEQDGVLEVASVRVARHYTRHSEREARKSVAIEASGDFNIAREGIVNANTVIQLRQPLLDALDELKAMLEYINPELGQ